MAAQNYSVPTNQMGAAVAKYLPYGGATGPVPSTNADWEQSEKVRQQGIAGAQLAAEQAGNAYNQYGNKMKQAQQAAAQGQLGIQRQIGQQFGNAALQAGRGGGGAYGGNIAAGGRAGMLMAQQGASNAQQMVDMQVKYGELGQVQGEMEALAASKAMEFGNLNQDRQTKQQNYLGRINSAIEKYSKFFNKPEMFAAAVDEMMALEQDPFMLNWLQQKKSQGLETMKSWT